MGFADDREQLENGSVHWKDRLSPTIEMHAPDGTMFSAKWKGDPRRKEKKLGIFEFPHVNGNIVQDLGVNSTYYPLTIYFDGPDHDILASQFMEACDGKGPWQITHPVHGYIELQLIRAEEKADPVGSGNITEISTEWIEPINETTLTTTRQLAGIIDELFFEYSAITGGWYEDEVYFDTLGEQAACIDTAEAIAAKADTCLGDLATGNADVAAAWQEAKNALADAGDTSQEDFDPGVLAAGLRGVIQIPALGTADVDDRLSAYSDLMDEVIAELPTTDITHKGANAAATCETALDAILAASCRLVTTGTVSTRAAAVEAAEALLEMLQRMTEALDEVQALFEELYVDRQYFAQTATYQEAVKLAATAVRYLLQSAFNLAIEKTFTLDEAKAPIQICVEEYGNDDRLDEFIAWNDLHDTEILLLEAGRQVVVYV